MGVSGESTRGAGGRRHRVGPGGCHVGVRRAGDIGVRTSRRCCTDDNCFCPLDPLLPPSTTEPAGVVVESFEAPPASSATSAPTTSTTTILEVPARPEPTTSTSVPLSLGEQALERVSFDWRTRFPDWQVEFLSARDGIRALTFPAERRIEVFVRSTDTATTLHRVFAHELGHVIDVELNSDEDRARWSDVRDIDQRTPWWPSAESPDFDTGAGDFAEAFAVWETAVSTRSTVGGQPDADDLALLRELAAG